MLFGLLAGVIGVSSLNVFTAGSKHVDTVEENVELVVTTNSLKEENTKLVSKNEELQVMADSLIMTTDSLKETVSTLENKVDNYETTINTAKTSTTPDYIRQYKVVVPIEEVSDSTN